MNLLQACSFSAHLPKFNPAIPKLQELGEDLQVSLSKTKRVNSVANTSKIMWLFGFKYDQNKTSSNDQLTKKLVIVMPLKSLLTKQNKTSIYDSWFVTFIFSKKCTYLSYIPSNMYVIS